MGSEGLSLLLIICKSNSGREGRGRKLKVLTCWGVLVRRREGNGEEHINVFGSLRGKERELVYFVGWRFNWSSLPLHYPQYEGN